METQNKYTTLSIPFYVKDEFMELNLAWNKKNPTQRKTKEKFMIMLMNKFKENNQK